MIYPASGYAEEDAAVRAWISLRSGFMDANTGALCRGRGLAKLYAVQFTAQVAQVYC